MFCRNSTKIVKNINFQASSNSVNRESDIKYRGFSYSNCRKICKREYSIIKDANKDKILLIRSKTNNVFTNIATEEWIFNEMEPNVPVLYLWENSPTIVIGRHQNPWKECNLDLMERNNVVMCRRKSGGGAVYQDNGNFIFTFMSSKDRYNVKDNFAILKRAIDSFGVNSVFTGRNDIQVDGRKISGSAFRTAHDRDLHHGTILVNINKEDVAKYLNVNKIKLKSKGVDSVKQRIANLIEFSPDITNEKLSESLINEFCKFHNVDPKSCSMNYLDNNFLTENPSIRRISEELQDWNWRFGKTPQFEFNLETRFDWGIIDIYINVSDGIISQLKVYSDILYPDMIEMLESKIVNSVFNKSGMEKAIDDAKRESSGKEYEGYFDELKEWLLKQI